MGRILARMRLTTLLVLLTTATLAASDAYPPPRFADPGRVAKLQSAMPEIDRLFRAYATDKKIPGMIWGVVIDGQVAHLGSFGVRDRASQTPITPDTAFRIASMTKSFTALAVLKLRDDGRLSLEDPVSRWIPEFARMERPTSDTPPLTIRQLLSHSAGFPEDNPWGDQQLSATDAMMDDWLAKGIPFSTPPGTRYEYSNYAFGLLGRIVTNAAGIPYEQYVQTRDPLETADGRVHVSVRGRPGRAPSRRLPPQAGRDLRGGAAAAARRVRVDGRLADHGHRSGKYVAFHLSAWPARDDEDAGPVRRSSVREMAHLWTPSNLTAQLVNGTLRASETGYGFGLRVTSDCRFEQIVAHGGGLPGFGSYMAWLPDYGVGMFAMTTLTYSGPSEPISQAWDAMLKTGGLRKRELPPTTLQTEMRDRILNLWRRWDDSVAKQIAAVNFFLDAPSAERQAEIRALKNEVGECTDAGPVMPENWMRGQFNMTCANGTVGVFFTLAPTQPPAVQHLSFQKLASPAVRMGAPTGAPAGVSCTQ